MTRKLDVRNAVVALVCAALILLPVYSAVTGNIFILTLFTRIVIYALAAASLNLIMGYGGMMSFGHAAYLGIGIAVYSRRKASAPASSSGRWHWPFRHFMPW
jgi:branched-chain amino acid transport system permease protein